MLNRDLRIPSYTEKLTADNPTTYVTKLSCVQIENIFGYLLSPLWVIYKVIVDVDIITDVSSNMGRLEKM